MKNFTKLALATSIVAMSANSMAMTALDDATLSATTGQEGITIGIQIDTVTIDNLYIHDLDGATGVTGAGGAGSIVLRGTGGTGPAVTVTRAAKDTAPTADLVTLKIDADKGAGTNTAFLNIAADVKAVNVDIKEIGVQASGASYNAATNSRGVTGTFAKILDSLSLKLGDMTANIQLGNTPQGSMIKIGSTIAGGLAIEDLSLHDGGAKGGGDIVIGSIKVTDSGSADLLVDAEINVKNDGLLITSKQAASGHQIYINSVDLGGTGKSIGDVEIVGMKTTSNIGNGTTIRVTGH